MNKTIRVISRGAALLPHLKSDLVQLSPLLQPDRCSQPPLICCGSQFYMSSTSVHLRSSLIQAIIHIIISSQREPKAGYI